MDSHASGLLLVVAGWAGLVAMMAWIYRRRRAARDRARDERYRQMIEATLASRAGAGATVQAATGGPPVLPSGGQARSPVAVREPVRASPTPQPSEPAVSLVRGASGRAGAAAGPSEDAQARGGDAREQALRMADALLGLQPGGPVPGTSPAASPVPMRIRSPLLDAPARAMLLALRAAAPGHEVLVGPSLARLLDAPPGLSGVDRALRQRQAAGLGVDFAVCTRGMQLVATIDLQGQGVPAPERESRRAAATQLEAAGVRHLVFDPAQLPRYPELRVQMGLGEPEGGR